MTLASGAFRIRTLNSIIEHELLAQGACLVGFADLKNLSGMTGSLPRGISIAVALDPAIIRAISDGPTPDYFAEYKRANALLSRLCARAAKIVSQTGKQAKSIEPTTARFDERTLSMPVQHKTIATRAGLGWIGKSALLITKAYGPAIRLSSVLTDAELRTGDPMNESHCGDCRRCVDCCPAGAIAGCHWRAGTPREILYDAFTCRDCAVSLAGRHGIHATICGICINACPWTQRYISRELGDKNARGPK